MMDVFLLLFVKVTLATTGVVMLNFLVSRPFSLFFNHFVSEIDFSFLGSSGD